MNTGKETRVGIADMRIIRGEGTLITYALGSCVGISLYDPVLKLGGLLHIMLPESAHMTGMAEMNIYKFADTGIPEMIRKMQVFGGRKDRYQCKIAGGAKMFEMSGEMGNIGQRNGESVRRVLAAERIRILRQDVGQNYARTMSLDVPSGMVRIRTYGRQEIIL